MILFVGSNLARSNITLSGSLLAQAKLLYCHVSRVNRVVFDGDDYEPYRNNLVDRTVHSNEKLVRIFWRSAVESTQET
ncbi:MAG: hypothetical protein DMF61_21395 [Blastocatellia bacterium AA13]|nr:MAG: hypothetical protein DMF61_21395 [Blastocatellia bacterium AA13]